MVKTAPESSLKRPRHASAQSSPQVDYNAMPAAPPSPPPPAPPIPRRPLACERCRRRRGRCDKALPSCGNCRDAGDECTNIDPLTGRLLARNYVVRLEEQVAHLQALLNSNSIPYPSSDESSSREVSISATKSTSLSPFEHQGGGNNRNGNGITPGRSGPSKGMRNRTGSPPSKPFLTPFAKSTFAAGRDTNGTSHETVVSGPSLRNTFYRLDTQSAYEPAPFPEKWLGERYVSLYFEHANPQIPILHRGEFNELFETAYSSDSHSRKPRELYLLNIVFAIGAGMFLDEPDATRGSAQSPSIDSSASQPRKRPKPNPQEYGPEQYHAAAIGHLESFLHSSPGAQMPAENGLEELQGVLLLAGLALLRPIAPGLWFIIGYAVKLALDLGLHQELLIGTSGRYVARAKQNNKPSSRKSSSVLGNCTQIDPAEKGRFEWVQDLRRRLWWCVYSFDRLASTCLHRPFGISDDIVTTKYPSPLDDKYITRAGITSPPKGSEVKSYKLASNHYIEFRLLQSEILQVLQHQKAQQVWKAANDNCLRSTLQSPYLLKHNSFYAWRSDMDRRLTEWRNSAPPKKDTGVDFSLEFLELEYQQAIVMLYRQSLTVREDVQKNNGKKSSEEDQDLVFQKVALAGQTILKLYRKLQSRRLEFCSWMQSGILQRFGMNLILRQTLGELRTLFEGADVVFNALSNKCKRAIECKDIFAKLSRDIVKTFFSTSNAPKSTSEGSNLTTKPRITIVNGIVSEPSKRALLSIEPKGLAQYPRFDQENPNLQCGNFPLVEDTDMSPRVYTTQPQASEFHDYPQDLMYPNPAYNDNYFRKAPDLQPTTMSDITSPVLDGSQGRDPPAIDSDDFYRPEDYFDRVDNNLELFNPMMFPYNEATEQYFSGGPQSVWYSSFDC
ncbi:MAG: Fungal specific transcription factor [Trizodia sp. TS-e1964]|nr:MAG: Fungal specific transcription factor [Trizodia sp. TS-e1964]